MIRFSLSRLGQYIKTLVAATTDVPHAVSLRWRCLHQSFATWRRIIQARDEAALAGETTRHQKLTRVAQLAWRRYRRRWGNCMSEGMHSSGASFTVHSPAAMLLRPLAHNNSSTNKLSDQTGREVLVSSASWEVRSSQCLKDGADG